MSLDDRIKRELESEAEKIDDILNDKTGIYDLATLSLKGGLGKWMIMLNICVFIVAGLMLWCGYEFFFAESVDERVYWGVYSIVTLNIMMGLKAMNWNEANRISVLREVKRVEISVSRLSSQIEDIK